MALKLVWEAMDASRTTSRTIKAEQIYGANVLGVLLTCTSPASSREASVVVSPHDLLAFAGWIDKTYGILAEPAGDKSDV